MDALIPILAAVAAWISAALLDQAHFALHLRAAQAMGLARWYWGGIPLTLLFVAVLLASLWTIAIRVKSPRWIGLPLGALALLLLVSLPFVTTGLSPLEGVLGRPVLRSQVLLREAAPSSFFMIQTSAVVLSSLYALFRTTATRAATTQAA